MAEVQDAASEPSMEEILASIRKIIADEKPEPAAEEAAGEDVLELTQMVQDDGSVVDLAAGDPPAPPETPVAPEPAPAAPPPEMPPMPEPPPTPPPAKANGMDDGGLVSSRAASVASSSLAALANTVQVERMASMMPGMTPLGNGGRTLEDMVMELMKPMLKSWLDENLPAVVERLVQKEVERIARRASE